MAGTSFQFAGFALIVILLYQVSRTFAWRQTVLLAASLAYLATYARGVQSLLPLAGFVLLGYAGVRAIRVWNGALAPILLTTIAGFVWLKRYAFVPGGLLMPFSYATVGLSYIFFRVLHLMIESGTNPPEKCPSVAAYLNYTLNFTTLASGPIQLFEDFTATQRESGSSRLTAEGALPALERIVRGLFKAAVAALVFSTAQSRAIETVLNTPGNSAGKLVSGAVVFGSYSLFLYCNFSGFMDIVIGIGRLLGFTLPENFDRPFTSDNFLTFWNRWHITLSSWLKTYCYSPLLMACLRRFPAPGLEPAFAVMAFFVTFFLIGVWHGQTSEFLFYGFLQGLGVSGNKLYQILMAKWLTRKRYKVLAENRAYCAITRGLTFTWFTLTLTWFWSSWRQIGDLSHALGAAPMLVVWLAIWVFSTLALELWERIRGIFLQMRMDAVPLTCSSYWRTGVSTALLVVFLAASMLMNQSAPEMVYKAF